MSFCNEAFEKCGVCREDAEVCSEILVTADIRGIPSIGVARLKRYINGLNEGLMRPDCTSSVLNETPVSILVDADGSLGATGCPQDHGGCYQES